MRPWHRSALTCAWVSCAAAAAAGPVPMEANGLLSGQASVEISRAAGASEIVSLGESIHLTNEMPSARLGIVRQLHEQKSFNVLVFEGATIDAWTAQENVYRSKDAPLERARSFSQQALFGLWQTDAMVDVVRYALSTQGGEAPLYIASFDIQPGVARSLGGSSENSLKAFLATGDAVGAAATLAQQSQWVTALGPALGCKKAFSKPEALVSLTTWIQGPLTTALSKTRPSVHLETLQLVPVMLERRLEQCRQVRAGASYQDTRDVQNAALVSAMHDRLGKLILWAHHSHINHNSLGKAVPSMGQHLKRRFGEDLYTIGVFAAGGEAVDSLGLDNSGGPSIVLALAPRTVPADGRFEVENRLAQLSAKDFFLDLRSAGAEWSEPSRSRLEVDGSMQTSLARDFDGAILLHRVSGARMNFLPPAFQSLVDVVASARRYPIVALLVMLLLASGIILLARRVVGRFRRRKPLAPAARLTVAGQR